MEQIIEKFTDIGGVFVSDYYSIKKKISAIKAFIFDWDGVFNDGAKNSAQGSSFSEPDSMGVNMLRFAYWLQTKKQPITAIITGANNASAQFFSQRENFHHVFLNCKNKIEALTTICDTHLIKSHEIAFCYDDILDLEVAAQCGLSFLVKRNASPLLEEYVKNKKICDYISASPGGQNAVREISELLIGVQNQYETVITKRLQYEGDYVMYLEQRSTVNLRVHNFAK